jgi:hypothetical protein
MDYLKMTAPCGLDCFNCAIYLAGENEEIRASVAKRMNVPLELAVCRGCRTEGGCVTAIGAVEPCHVWKCISQKGLNFCYECSDFPCDHLHPYADKAAERPHNVKVFNLNLIKKMGLESWAKDKAKKVRNTYFKEPFKL